MNSETLKALKASIRHWKENVAKAKKELLRIDDVMASACPLCIRFGIKCISGKEKCPVAEKSKVLVPFACGCNNTPWIKINEALCSYNNTFVVLTARAELKFLQSLLPKKRKQCPTISKMRSRK